VTEYINVSGHAQPLEGGAVLGEWERVTLKQLTVHDESLVTDGLLMSIADYNTKHEVPAKSGTKGGD
jgi:hypothetical protein